MVSPSERSAVLFFTTPSTFVICLFDQGVEVVARSTFTSFTHTGMTVFRQLSKLRTILSVEAGKPCCCGVLLERDFKEISDYFMSLQSLGWSFHSHGWSLQSG